LHVLLCLALALSACGKKDEPGAVGAQTAAARANPSAPEARGSADFQKPVLEGLRKAGLAVGEFETTAAKPYQARACTRGEVGNLDVMACQYASAQAAEQARSSLEQFVAGSGTGAVRRSGTVALAVADLKKVDPRGKVIDKVLKTFASLGLP
jgi:hypothetical protein